MNDQVKRREWIKSILVCIPALSWIQLSCESQDEVNDLFLLSALEGAEFVPGETVTIRWSSNRKRELRVEFTGDGGNNWILLDPEINLELGFFEWKIPDVLSDQCKLRISYATGALLTASHPGYFSIVAGFSLDVNENKELSNYPSLISYSHNRFGLITIRRVAANSFLVHSLVCTHSGCELFPDEIGYECRCHGSSFNVKGCVITGPAVLPLTTYRNIFDERSHILRVYLDPVATDC